MRTDAVLPLQCTALTAGFERPLLGPLNLELQPGERTLLTGPNGSGKSLLLQVLTGRARVFSGVVSLASPAPSYLAQEHPRPNPWPLNGHDWFAAMQIPTPTAPAVQRLLPQRLDRLSGGQWQLLRLAAVLSSGAQQHWRPLILLDEPSNHLDAEVRATAVQLIREVPASCTMLLTSHDQDFIRELGFPVVALEHLLERQ